MTKFSERLKAARKKAGLTQVKLAQSVGVGKGAVGNWETAVNGTDPEMLRKLAKILGTTENYLSGESDIDIGAFSKPATEYSASLKYSDMKDGELNCIFQERQAELAKTTDPDQRRFLFGIISDAAAELKKRGPAASPDIKTEKSAADLVSSALKRTQEDSHHKPEKK